MLWSIGGVESREPRLVRLVWRGSEQRIGAEMAGFTYNNHGKCSLEEYVKSPNLGMKLLYEQDDVDVDSVVIHPVRKWKREAARQRSRRTLENANESTSLIRSVRRQTSLTRLE